jgi:hypothetical protein
MNGFYGRYFFEIERKKYPNERRKNPNEERRKKKPEKEEPDYFKPIRDSFSILNAAAVGS